MSLYDISTTQLSSDLLPDHERTIENKTFLGSLLSGINRNKEIFASYRLGADVQAGATIWAAGSYAYLDWVIYLPTGAVYECVVATSTTPGTSTDWLKVLDSFIGNDEMQYYNGGNLIMEWALNRRFNSTFRQLSTGLPSDTYLENVNQPDAMFQIGGDEDNSSAIYADTCSESITKEDTTTSNIGLYIYMKTATWTPLGANTAQREASVRNFVDKYITAGIFYQINVY